MRTVPVTAIFEDGTVPSGGGAPLAVSAANIGWWQWTDGRLAITAIGSNGNAFDISGGVFHFTARTRNQATPPVIANEGVIDNGPGGLAHVDIAATDVGIAAQTLSWNLAFVDSGNKTWAVTAQGYFAVLPSEYVPS